MITAHWPPPADPATAALLRERIAELGRPWATLARRHAGLLDSLGGNSPYLADLAWREAPSLRLLLRDGPDAVAEAAFAQLGATEVAAPRPIVAAALRRAKRKIALATAIADIGGIWDLTQVTGTLSRLADATLGVAVAHLLRIAHDSGELRLPHPADPQSGSGFVVLGMGKLGARELNYSSDIDLILLRDPAAGVYHGESPAAFHTRLARNLVALIEARDSDGYVFRTDLRLRPDPSATPPCIALPTAIAYYQTMGQNWERAAMLKARPVAGDQATGAAFLDAIRPFIWRHHLDFAAVADIHAMKRRIDAHRHTGLTNHEDPVARIAGHNVKLGEGGIREIEFLVQTLQLVWGGRDPSLRAPATLEAMALLVQAGHLSAAAAAELTESYDYLRRVEHRLQMVADRQTHSLPEDPAGIARIATFLGETDATGFARRLLHRLGRVQSQWHALFGTMPETGPDTLDFSGDGPPKATIAALRARGYTRPEAVVAAVRGWQAGRIRALRSPRARELLDSVLPGLLAALARQSEPDVVFARFDEILGRLPAGVQILSMFQRNPALLDRVAAVLGSAPSLANHLTHSPNALEGLLQPAAAAPPERLLRTRLGPVQGLEETIATIRATVRQSDFAISVATLEGRIDVDAAGLARSRIADATLAALLPPVLADFARRFGRIPGGQLAVVLLGKAGGQETMAGSDLDLMLIYDHPAEATESTGKIRRLAPSQWFIRAAHAYVAALTAPDAAGPMFDVDMRLRPSGNKGPVAVSLAGFVRYHAEDAWTWERMALTRARIVAGPLALRRRVATAISEAIAAAGPPPRIHTDIAAMRTRMLRELPPSGPWDVKLRPGGQIDVEFIAQTLILLHPDCANPTTRLALGKLQAAGHLAEADAATLIAADRLWRSVQGAVRIAYGRAPPEQLSASASAFLLRAAATGDPDIATLRASLDLVARDVRTIFLRLVGNITGWTA